MAIEWPPPFHRRVVTIGELSRHQPRDYPNPSAEGHLDSWKEIAAYLKRSVSTVQRWERSEGLPVHRHVHSKLGTVYAYKTEVDAWWNERRPQLEEQEQALATAPGRRWLWVVAPLALVLVLGSLAGLNVGRMRDRLLGRALQPRIESLAVLPLENLSGDPDQEYFADGLTDALITDLAKLRSLRVISRTSAMQYRGAKKPLPQIARELRVDAVVEGTVLRSGNRVRINVQLVHGPSDRHLWAETYEGSLGDMMGLQRAVTQAIARELRIELTAEEQARLGRRQVVSPEAYEAYLMGRYFWNKRTVEGFRKAIQHFEEAIRQDPDYAPAYAGLADSQAYLGLWAMPGGEAIQRARAAVEKALQIDDTLAEAHTSQAMIAMAFEWDWEKAEREFRRALELNPSYATAHHWYGYYFMALGRFDEAAAELERAQELDPLSLIINANLGFRFYWARQYDQAIQHLQKTLEVDPNFPLVHSYLGLVYVQKGMYEEALAAVQRAHTLSGSRHTGGPLGYTYGVMGRRQEAQAQLKALLEASEQEFVPPYYIALVYVGLGEADHAFQWLEQAYKDRSGYLFELKVDPMFDPLRSDPRFQDLLRRIRLST